MLKTEFIVSGNSGDDLATELELLYKKWYINPSETTGKRRRKKLTLRIIITDITCETSVEHCIRYACSEIRDGIVSAGGTIWDGTHVQIMRDET